MDKPHHKLTVYYTEGNQTAALITTTGQRRRVRNVRHASAEAALKWCRAHRAMFVYTPAMDHTGN